MNQTPLSKKILLINKPVNWTSFDVVGFIRKKMIAGGAPKNIRVGHAGTLDPFATGLLIVGVGREATKHLDDFKNLHKTYVATVRLGAISDTGDLTGKITPYHAKFNLIKWILKKIMPGRNPDLRRDDIEKVIKKFIGKSKQIPPMYSAKKINGQKLYELARKGKIVERQANPIEIYDIKLLDYNYPDLKIEVTCSAGTYIRTLAEDIGKKLETGAYCQDLTRTKIGEYDLADAVLPVDVAQYPNKHAD